MNIQTTASFANSYDGLQWAGKGYILEELNEETGALPKAGIVYSPEVMYWTAYIYRCWHYYTHENSHQIYEAANAKVMNVGWDFMF